MSAASTHHVLAVSRLREFTRFYLPALGLLDRHYLGSSYSPAEARVLFEVYQHDGCNAAHIARTMNLDKSYLSRILKSHEKSGYLFREVSPSDARSFRLHLTAQGAALAQDFIQKSDQQIGALIADLPPDSCRELTDALDTVTRLLQTAARKERSL